jgi:tRNA threonylcarbamoyladenosine dehydratase
MRGLKSPELFRNMGFWNCRTQQAICDTRIGIAGLGGAGYLVGVEAARIGVQRFTVADPEAFEPVNSNRVLAVGSDTVGRNKAEVFVNEIQRINPTAQVRIFTEGVTPENVREFMHQTEIVLDATELSMPELGTMICREARRINVPVIDVEYVAHAGQGTSFRPNSRMTFERFMGIRGGENAPLDEVAEQELEPSRYLAYIPPYGDLRTLMAVQKGAPLPSNMIGAGVAAQIAVAELVKYARERVGERGARPTVAPRVRWYDAYTNVSGTTRYPRVSYYRHLAVAAISNLVGKYEAASYSTEDRKTRGDLDGLAS